MGINSDLKEKTWVLRKSGLAREQQNEAEARSLTNISADRKSDINGICHFLNDLRQLTTTCKKCRDFLSSWVQPKVGKLEKATYLEEK